MNNEHNKNLMFKVAGVLLLLVIALVAMVFTPQPQAVNPNPGHVYDTTIQGEYICLPHKDTSGPQTMECALGIRAMDGNNYSLDLGEILQAQEINFPMGSQLEVTGTIVPVEMLSSNHWQKYDMRGIIRVSEIKVK